MSDEDIQVEESSGLSEYATSAAMRDAIQAMVAQKLDELRPAPKYGTVTAIDLPAFKADVRLNGDVNSVTVNCGSHIPDRVGQIVRVGGSGSDRYIEDVLAPAPLILTVPGEVRLWAGSAASVPDGWILCDGRDLSRTGYAKLFAAIGTTYGSGGGTTFRVPDLRSRVAVGFNSTEVEFNTLGKTGGAKTHTLTVAEMPEHTHGPGASTYFMMGPGSTGLTGDNSQGYYSRDRALTTGETGGSGAHNNLQPYLTLHYIIAT